MSDDDSALIASRLSIAYMTAIASELSRTFPLDFLDLLLVGTIANFNASAAPVKPKRRGRPSKAPPLTAGISRNAVSRALNVPLETVRRRVAVLIQKKVLREQADGLVFQPENPLALGSNTQFQAFNMEMLRQLFRGLKANGIKLD